MAWADLVNCHERGGLCPALFLHIPERISGCAAVESKCTRQVVQIYAGCECLADAVERYKQYELQSIATRSRQSFVLRSPELAELVMIFTISKVHVYMYEVGDEYVYHGSDDRLGTEADVKSRLEPIESLFTR